MRALASLLTAVVLLLANAPAAGAQPAEPAERRLALVIGNGEYAGTPPLPTAANDAGLVAQTLQAAGFDVMGARDLDGDALRHTFRDFVAKATEAGPDGVVFVYLAGHGLQLEGENFFVPVDARIDRDVDVPLQALRIADYLRPIAAAKPKAVFLVLDAARDNPFARSGQPLAGGLALVDPVPGIIVAFNAAPGTIAPEVEPPYGPYAQALAEMIREGGLPPDVLLDRVRLRVNDITGGNAVPWHTGSIETPFVFLERGPEAPRIEASHQTLAARRERPIRAFDPQEAYLAALERDTLAGYQEFVEAFPEEPLARRVRAIVAARREAITWRRTREADTPEAYWSYLDRYPKGPHAGDARRRLAFLTAPVEPPPGYAAFAYADVPPPPRDEIVLVERRVVMFADPVWRFAPPPPAPIVFLPPPPPRLFFPPPPPPVAVFVLPQPRYVPVPVYVRAPARVSPPPNNAVFVNIHRTTVINNTTVVAPRGGGNAATAPSAASPTANVALPPSVAARAARAQPAAATPAQAGSPVPATAGAPPPAPKAAGQSAPAGAGGGPPAAKLLPGDPKGTVTLPPAAKAAASAEQGGASGGTKAVKPGAGKAGEGRPSDGKDAGRPAERRDGATRSARKDGAPDAERAARKDGGGDKAARTTTKAEGGAPAARDGVTRGQKGIAAGETRTPRAKDQAPPDAPRPPDQAAAGRAGQSGAAKGTFLKDAPHVKAAGLPGAEAAKRAAQEKRQQRGEARRAEERTLDRQKAERLESVKRPPPGDARAVRAQDGGATPPPLPAGGRPGPLPPASQGARQGTPPGGLPRGASAAAGAPPKGSPKEARKCGGQGQPPCR